MSELSVDLTGEVVGEAAASRTAASQAPASQPRTSQPASSGVKRPPSSQGGRPPSGMTQVVAPYFKRLGSMNVSTKHFDEQCVACEANWGEQELVKDPLQRRGCLISARPEDKVKHLLEECRHLDADEKAQLAVSLAAAKKKRNDAAGVAPEALAGGGTASRSSKPAVVRLGSKVATQGRLSGVFPQVGKLGAACFWGRLPLLPPRPPLNGSQTHHCRPRCPPRCSVRRTSGRRAGGAMQACPSWQHTTPTSWNGWRPSPCTRTTCQQVG